MSPTAPGWYRAPLDDAWRYWDGHRWSGLVTEAPLLAARRRPSGVPRSVPALPAGAAPARALPAPARSVPALPAPTSPVLTSSALPSPVKHGSARGRPSGRRRDLPAPAVDGSPRARSARRRDRRTGRTRRSLLRRHPWLAGLSVGLAVGVFAVMFANPAPNTAAPTPGRACRELDGSTYAVLADRYSPFVGDISLERFGPITRPRASRPDALGGAQIASACRYVLRQGDVQVTAELYLGRGENVVTRLAAAGGAEVSAGDAAAYLADRRRPVGVVQVGDRFAAISGVRYAGPWDGGIPELKPGSNLGEASERLTESLLGGLGARLGRAVSPGTGTDKSRNDCRLIAQALPDWAVATKLGPFNTETVPDEWQAALGAAAESCGGSLQRGSDTVRVAALTFPNPRRAALTTTAVVNTARAQRYDDPQPRFAIDGSITLRTRDDAGTAWTTVGPYVLIIDGPASAVRDVGVALRDAYATTSVTPTTGAGRMVAGS